MMQKGHGVLAHFNWTCGQAKCRLTNCNAAGFCLELLHIIYYYFVNKFDMMMYGDQGPGMPMAIDITSVPSKTSTNTVNHPTSMSHSSEKHPKKMMEAFNVLRKRQELWDVILVVGNTKLFAHRVVLAAASPYFHVRKF